MEKPHLMKYSTVCLDEKKEGVAVGWLVSITALSGLNEALLGKCY